MRNFFMIIAFFSFVAPNAFTQNSQQAFGLKGQLTNITNNPIPYATVALYVMSSEKLVEGKLSDKQGAFVFEEQAQGVYKLKVSCMGFKDIIKDSIVLSDLVGNVDLGTITLMAESVNLDEVSIIKDRIKGEELIDRTVYNIVPAMIQASQSGMDLLKLIPSVHIDIDNNISLEGGENIEIYVDGRRSNKDYVFSLNPDLIDRIEVITNPSSVYDSEITGVIRIITKRQNNRGGSVGLNTKIPLGENFNSNNSFNVNYNCKKLSLQFNMRGQGAKWQNNRTIFRQSWMNDTTFMLQDGIEKPWYGSLQPSITLGYFFNKKNSLSFYTHYAYRGYGKVQHMEREESDIINGLETKDNYTTLKKFDWDYFNDAYSLFYRKTFDRTETELLTTLSYSQWHDKGIDYNNDVNLVDATTETRNFIRKDSEQVLAGKLDFSTKIMESIRFEAGYAMSNQQLKDNLIGTVDGFDATLDLLKDSLNYDETRNAGYINFSGTAGKFNWMVGLRLENSDITINKTTPAGYTCLLPNISVQKKLEGKKSLKLTYRRRIRRPQSNHLNPFLKQNEKLTYEKGDPNINPSYVNRFVFSYNHAKEKNMLSPKVYFNYNQDNINRVGLMSNEGILTKTWKNGGNSYEYGLQFSGQLQLFKWWALNPFLEIGHAHINGIKNTDFFVEAQSDIIWNLNASSVMTFFENLNIIMDFNWSSPGISLQTYRERAPYYNLQIDKAILKNKAKIGLDVFTPFATKWLANKTTIETNNDYQHFKQVDTIELFYNYRILVVFSYKLKWGEMKNKMDIDSNDINSGRGGGF